MGLSIAPGFGAPTAAPSLDVPGFFGGDSGITYEELQARKKIARELMGGNGTIRNVGEGINSAAGSIAGALMKRRADKEESKQRDAFNSSFNDVVGGIFGGGYSPTVSTKTPGAEAPMGGAPGGWDEIQAGIFAGESGGDYDALFGYSNRPGGQFSGTKLTDMTVDQALAFADPSGPYGQWVKGQVGRVATPMGAYQVVGTTLRGVKDAMGLTGNERMTPELQDAIGQHIYATQGTGAWEGYQGPRASTKGIQTAQNGPVDPAIIQQLAQIAGSPYASPGQKAIVSALLGQQLQAMQPQKPNYQFIKGIGVVDMNNPNPDIMAGTFDPQAVEDDTEYGLTPQYITREDGSLGMVVLGKDGTAKEVDLPEGVALQKGIEKLDLGTSYQWYNTVTGEPIGEPIKKDLAGAEAEKAIGKAEGEAQADAEINLPDTIARAEEQIALIDSIINDPALASITGNFQGRIPAGTPLLAGGQAGANLDVKIKQIQGQVFMEAYDTLKGGGQITEIEGKKAEEALARLNRAQSTDEYIKALQEFQGIVRRGVERAKRRAGAPDAPQGVEDGQKPTHRFNPQTGKIEVIE